MKDEIKEIYLSDLEWTKTHDNIGGVMGNLIFKDNMSYEDYQRLLKNDYFVLCNKDYITNLQTIEQQYSAILSENAELENKINNLQQRCEYLERSNNRREDEIMSLRNECVDGEDYKSRNEKAIEKLKTLMPICIMPNNMLIHGTEKAKAIEETLNILQGEDKDE